MQSKSLVHCLHIFTTLIFLYIHQETYKIISAHNSLFCLTDWNFVGKFLIKIHAVTLILSPPMINHIAVELKTI